MLFLEDTGHDSHPNVITGTYILRLNPNIIIVPGFLWARASDDEHKEVNVQVYKAQCRRLGEKCCRKLFEDIGVYVTIYML